MNTRTDMNAQDPARDRAQNAAADPAKESASAHVSAVRRVWALREGRTGIILTGLVLLISVFGPLLAQPLTGFGPTEFADKPFQDSGIFGTDDLGRSVAARFLAGGLRLLCYSVLATALGLALGALLGIFAAYAGGVVDQIIMRINDVLLAIPQLVFALLAITVLGTHGWVLVTVIGITHAPRVARVARAATLGVIGEDYIRAAEMYAVPRWRIVVQEIAPNITGPLSVEAGLRLTYSIGTIASLSFLGLGMQPPVADWGLMINENRIALSVQPWGVLLPVAAIAVLTIGTNLLADAIARATANTNVEA
ncbi:ABC transporter permease [Brevibacterium sp. 50QC2O2]|jgi:peptide/nickel transport system permease protein|uniref:ABC transporter permease n=1 Tax=Brevibacterium TaxID=1696 RepID=UPI00211B8624|nr:MULTISPECIES: ABC transporter permease [unclassified Brevibacterium]MCQ9369417.1 ABC transporter permease [Brevibacterium sp. 91QC2O2]MCQ9386766.1 ABC transporter permease [Brevibacterium sp. 68QC2CO]MCQ9389648.1 ABC transporter permease [Brevibacterium sp. 50QC2O2]